jgi:hypothetical protein
MGRVEVGIRHHNIAAVDKVVYSFHLNSSNLCGLCLDSTLVLPSGLVMLTCGLDERLVYEYKSVGCCKSLWAC